MEERKNKIYAVAGGKGGCGKSIISSVLAVNVARNLGEKTLLVDTDLGGANLHSFLSVRSPQLTLKHFFLDKKPLAEIITATPFANLNFIAGDFNYLERDINNYLKHLAFFKQLSRLPFSRIFLDIGAGSHNFCLEAAAVADDVILITLPDIISVENLYLFLKKLILKKIKLQIVQADLKAEYEAILKKNALVSVENLEKFLKVVRAESFKIGQIIDNVYQNSRFFLIINQVRNQAHCDLGNEISYVLQKWLKLNITYLGYVFFFENLWEALDGRANFWTHPQTQNFQKQVAALFNQLNRE